MNIKCYDNGGKTIDRYTVVYLDFPCDKQYGKRLYNSVGMSGSPFHPQGFGQHGECLPGRHLGKLIPFDDLPEDCQKLVHQDLKR